MSTLFFQNYINGHLVPAAGGQVIEKFNPFNGQKMGEVAASDAIDVIQSLVHAKKAQAEFAKDPYSTSSYQERAELLDRVALHLEKKSNDYAWQEALHQGLSQKFVLEKSILPSARFFRRAAEECRHYRAESAHALPVGIVSIISSWCLSLRLVCERLAPALAAGNAVMIKVSELSPVTGHILAEILNEAKVPAGLVQVFQGNGSQVGGLLAAHPSIRAVSFVGDSIHAESIIRATTVQFKKVQVSAGSKNSCLILADTDYAEQMPKILNSFLMGQGQLCWNSQRLFLPESISTDFIATMKNYLSTLPLATDPASPEASIWPLIARTLVDKTGERTREAQAEHAKIIFGETADVPDLGDGFFVKPTFTLDLTNCSVLQQDELHLGLFILTAVKYQHEMVKWSNTGYFGHSAVVWGSFEKALKAGRPLQVSKVWINDWLNDDESIFGQKQSSYGNLDMRSFGSFFSDVKNLTAPN